MFYPSCRYLLTIPEDIKDVNKILGIGYFQNHQIDSARFGWYYSNEYEKIVMVAYSYINGVLVKKDLTFLKVAYPYDVALIIENGVYKFRVYETSSGVEIGKHDEPFYHKKKWSYPMNVFFGGSNPAPHDMKIDITKI